VTLYFIKAYTDLQLKLTSFTLTAFHFVRLPCLSSAEHHKYSYGHICPSVWCVLV